MTVENSTTVPCALGVFRAVKTRDGVGLTRDQWPYFAWNRMGVDATGSALYEIQFADGQWMLAVGEDLSEFLPRS